MDAAFVLHHVAPENERHDEDVLLIELYRTETAVKAAIERLKSLPGFCDCSDGFEFARYELDRDHWTEGFIRND